MNQWSSGRARLAHAAIPALAAALLVGFAVHERNPVALAVAAACVALAVRCARISLRLDPDAAVVRNPMRTYRYPYGTVTLVDEQWLDLVSKTPLHILGSPVLRLHAESRAPVVARAMVFLPAAERDAAKAMLLDLVRSSRPAGHDEDLDLRPPYDTVLDLLVAADPAGWARDGHPADYAADASDLAGILRDEPLTEADLRDSWEDPPPGLLDRLNALRG